MQRFRPDLALAFALLAALPARGSPTRPAAPTAKAAEQADDPHAPLPKPLPRGQQAPSPAATLPPFLGVFGPAELLEKTGFRSAPGRFIVYRVGATTGETLGTARYQEVGPAIRGARWVEFLASLDDRNSAGFRMLVRGDGVGNLERLIARSPEVPPLEFNLDSVDVDMLPEVMAQGAVGGKLAKVGRERTTVPLGTFETDHWRLKVGGKDFDWWVTSDPKIPFTGAVKMSINEGMGVAIEVGTNAVGTIPVPARAK
jgi:hypothetical protein